MEGRGSSLVGGKRFLSSLRRPDRLCGQPSGGETVWAEVKRPACEVDHLPACSAKVKIEWRYAATPPIRLHGMGREKLLCFSSS